MKTLTMLPAAAFLALIVASPLAHAEKVTAGTRVTLDPTVALPVGDLADAAGFGFGASVALRLAINENIGLSGRTGFLYHLPKDGATFLALPAMVGLSYGFKPEVTTPYLALEIGPVVGRAALDGAGSDTETKFGGTFGGGYRLSFADIRAGVQVYNFGKIGDSLSLFAALAFRIAKF